MKGQQPPQPPQDAPQVGGPPPPLHLVQPAPVTTLTGQGEAGGQRFVLLRFDTPNGTFCFLLSPQHAAAFADEIAQAAVHSRSGLTVVGKV